MSVSTKRERVGDWLQVFSGIKFYPLDPRPEEIHIRDIAHGLSHVCRYGGHCRKFFSVAQHCVILALYHPIIKESILLQRVALLHDASEAYLGDIPRPIKYMDFFKPYMAIEKKLQSSIFETFGLEKEMHPLVKQGDSEILYFEMQHLMRPVHPEWEGNMRGLDIEIDYDFICWCPEEAEYEYLNTFNTLFKGTEWQDTLTQV